MRSFTKTCTLACGLLVLLGACEMDEEEQTTDEPIVDGVRDPSNPPPPITEPEDFVNNHVTSEPLERPAGFPIFEASGEHPKTQPMGSEDLVIIDKTTAFASDATTDAIYIVDLEKKELAHTVSFEEGSWPGRMATTTDGVYAVLRGSGELVKVNLDGQITRRARVCDAPRGVAMDNTRGKVWVACASSEVVALEPESLVLVDTFHVDSDLRDVVANSRGLYVSRFRAAQILRLDPVSGALIERRTPPSVAMGEGSPTINTLWRMVDRSDGNLILSYQESALHPLFITEPDPDPREMLPPEGYGSGGVCRSGAVSSVLALVATADDGAIEQMYPECNFGGSMAVDIDDAGCHIGMPLSGAPLISDQSANGPSNNSIMGDPTCPPVTRPHIHHTKLAAAVIRHSETEIQHLVLTRGEALYISSSNGSAGREGIELVEESPAHIGHVLFHGNTGAGIACASCHPEGGDDGQAWKFFKLTKFEEFEFTRRTQNLRGGLEGKLHWDGEFDDVAGLMDDVFSRRMGGFKIIEQDADAITHWLGQLQPEPGMTHAPDQQAQVARGEQLFEEAGCAGCHAGSMFTDYELYDVGTGGMRKTPTLRGIANRTRLMSDGCASTLEGRFDPDCGGGDMHGTTSRLSQEDKDALIVYLKTL